MKLKDAIATSDTYSGKTSEIVRQLSLAGIAIVWVFKSGTADKPQLDPKLIGAALFIVCALFLDLLQYMSSFYIWLGYVRFKEKKGLTDESDLEPRPSPKMNWFNYICFAGKTAAMGWAYGRYILPYLCSRFLH